MKKTVALLLIVCLLMGTSFAFAADHPFKADVNYLEKYRENGARPTMLNFGWAKLAPGENLYDAKKTTVRNIKAEKLEDLMDQNVMFYNYAKWIFLKGFDSHFINAMLVLTSPDGKYYATYGEWDLDTSKENAVYSWFFDVTDCLRRVREENDGVMPKGEYAFSMFFNNQSFRVSKFNVR